MEKVKESLSESEDIPSDFFDDFNKEEFIEGLSVIDSCGDVDSVKHTASSRSRINAEAVDSVSDLRELIREPMDDDYYYRDFENRHKLSLSTKPGSRRDPSKTNQAIKRDKEKKVKELLAKSAHDDSCPPGTELDNLMGKNIEPKQRVSKDRISPEMRRKVNKKMTSYKFESSSYNKDYLKERLHQSPHNYYKPKYMRHSPHRKYHRSPQFIPRSPRRRSPHWSPNHSPKRFRRNFSPHHPEVVGHYSTRDDPRDFRMSRSPEYQKRLSRRSYTPSSRSEHASRHNVSYGESSHPGSSPDRYQTPRSDLSQPPNFHASAPGSYKTMPSYSYQPPVGYAGYMVHEYGPPPEGLPQRVVHNFDLTPAPLPVPAPLIPATPVGAPVMLPSTSVSILQTAATGPAPSMVKTMPAITQQNNVIAPYDALAKLVAEGKISQEDYLKLTPNKGLNCGIDSKTRVTVLSRCNEALSKLGQMTLPNKIIVNNMMVGQELKCLAPKFCSPLKRQEPVEFVFTKRSVDPVVDQVNKRLVDCIISTIGLDQVIEKSKKKPAKNTREVAVQTMKPFCDICEVRETTKYYEVSTMTEVEHFTTTVHTQVVEQDLVSSKVVFNPSGSVGDAAPMSIAHMTPAQLVSQLAARAKTFKQADSSQSHNPYPRRDQSYYDGRGRGNNYGNYNY